MGRIHYITLVGFTRRIMIHQVARRHAPTIEPTGEGFLPFGASQAQLEQLDLIGGPFDLLAVQAHMHRVPQIQAHGGHDDQHPVLFAEFPELEPTD